MYEPKVAQIDGSSRLYLRQLTECHRSFLVTAMRTILSEIIFVFRAF